MFKNWKKNSLYLGSNYTAKFTFSYIRPKKLNSYISTLGLHKPQKFKHSKDLNAILVVYSLNCVLNYEVINSSLARLICKYA